MRLSDSASENGHESICYSRKGTPLRKVFPFLYSEGFLLHSALNAEAGGTGRKNVWCKHYL